MKHIFLIRARGRTHVFWGSCWTALKVPFPLFIFFVHRAQQTRRRGEERKKKTKKKILGKSWNPRRANNPRLRLHTSRLKALFLRSINRGFTNNHQKKILTCYIIVLSIVITINLFRIARWQRKYYTKLEKIRNLEYTNNEIQDSSGLLFSN